MSCLVPDLRHEPPTILQRARISEDAEALPDFRPHPLDVVQRPPRCAGAAGAAGLPSPHDVGDPRRAVEGRGGPSREGPSPPAPPSFRTTGDLATLTTGAHTTARAFAARTARAGSASRFKSHHHFPHVGIDAAGGGKPHAAAGNLRPEPSQQVGNVRTAATEELVWLRSRFPMPVGQRAQAGIRRGTRPRSPCSVSSAPCSRSAVTGVRRSGVDESISTMADTAARALPRRARLAATCRDNARACGHSARGTGG